MDFAMSHLILRPHFLIPLKIASHQEFSKLVPDDKTKKNKIVQHQEEGHEFEET